MTDIPKLIELAKAATKGPWHVQDPLDFAWSNFNNVPIGECYGKGGQAQRNAAFIAACSPEAILALIDQLATARNDALEGFKNSLDLWLNDYLVEMKPNYDDSITGFNEAWDVMRKCLDSKTPAPVPPTVENLDKLQFGKVLHERPVPPAKEEK